MALLGREYRDRNFPIIELRAKNVKEVEDVKLLGKIFEDIIGGADRKADTAENRQSMWIVANEFSELVPLNERAAHSEVQVVVREKMEKYYEFLADKLGLYGESCLIDKEVPLDMQRYWLVADINDACKYNLALIMDALVLPFNVESSGRKALNYVLDKVITPRIEKDEKYFQDVIAVGITKVVDMFEKYSKLYGLTEEQKNKIQNRFLNPLGKSLKNGDLEYDSKHLQFVKLQSLLLQKK